MPSPIETLRKLKGKSWSELRTRSGQALSTVAEQIGISGTLPSDADFLKLVDPLEFNDLSNETIWAMFFRQSEYSFFPSFRENEDIFELYQNQFGQKVTRKVLERADNILEGKFQLLGYTELDFGEPIDWHFDPTSKTHSPKKHWKQFDEISTVETGDKKVIWELNRHQYFFTLGIAYGLTGNEKYAETFVAHIGSWMDENPPGIGLNWFSSLEVSFRAISWIWAFHFFKSSHSFTPELFGRALKFLYAHGRHVEKYLSTYYSPNTHLTGEALGLYYLGTQFPFFKRAADWRKKGEDILFAELDNQILRDGGYFELTTWYHRYTTEFYTQFLILKGLQSKKNGRHLDQKLIKKLNLLMDFLMSVTRPDGTTPLIGDDDGGRCLPFGNAEPNDFRHCLSNGSILFNRSDLKFVAGEFSEESLWLFGIDGLESFQEIKPELPGKTTIAFEDTGLYVMRDGWRPTDNFLLVDCGELGFGKGGHGHSDALAIDLAVSGKSSLIDSGTYTYHESEELRNWFRSTAAHNTLEIDGKSQSDLGGKFTWNTKAKCQLRKWISHPRFNYFEGSHDGYRRLKPAPATHTRSILFLRNDYWVMRDFVKTAGKHKYRLNFNFAPDNDPKIGSQENDLEYIENHSSGFGGMRIFTFGDNGSWETYKIDMSGNFGAKSESTQAAYSSQAKGNQEFFTFLLPAENGCPSPEVSETEVANGRAFVVKYRNYIDILVYNDGESNVRTEFFNSNFRWVWARISDIEAPPEEYVLVGGSFLEIAGCEILKFPKTLNFATARRFGDQMNVQTSESIISVMLSKLSAKKPKS